MDAGDVIQKNKSRAMWVNYQTITRLQPGCTVGCSPVSSCIIRYPTYEVRDDIREGRANCVTTCTSTLVACYITGYLNSQPN